MDPIPLLQQALNESHKSLELDKNGKIEEAIYGYYKTLELMDKSIELLTKRPSRSSRAAMEMILEKKYKYSERITLLMNAGGQYTPTKEGKRPAPPAKSRIENYQFTDFNAVS
jgi:hypothetical protein